MKISKIRRYRRRAGLTQTQVAKAIGKTVGCISQYETGMRGIPVPAAKKMAKLYGVPWSELYEDDEDGAITDSKGSCGKVQVQS